MKISALVSYMLSYYTLKGTDEGLSIWQSLFVDIVLMIVTAIKLNMFRAKYGYV